MIDMSRTGHRLFIMFRRGLSFSTKGIRNSFPHIQGHQGHVFVAGSELVLRAQSVGHSLRVAVPAINFADQYPSNLIDGTSQRLVKLESLRQSIKTD